jgi:hypothetical protein
MLYEKIISLISSSTRGRSCFPGWNQLSHWLQHLDACSATGHFPAGASGMRADRSYGDTSARLRADAGLRPRAGMQARRLRATSCCCTAAGSPSAWLGSASAICQGRV